MVVRPVVCRPFVGRRDELAYLNQRRLDAAASHGGLVLVVGEAGIGKSRLVAELCAPLKRTRWRVGRGACLEYVQTPYRPVVEALATLEASARALERAETKREQLDAIAARFARIAQKHAAVIVIEDAHWADVATLDTLAFVAPSLERMRILLVVTARPNELRKDEAAHAAFGRLMRAPHAGRIDLGPLRDAERRTFVDAALDGHALPETTRRSVARMGDGNPFFTEELLKSAVEHATAGATAGAETLPSSVRGALLDRLRPLDERERRVIAQAAVVGRTFDLALLAETLDADVPGVLPALQRARDLQLVEEVSETQFRFRHALTRETIYDGFLSAQRRPLHRRIALALERDGEARHVDGLAYHWWAAGDHERAFRYNALAGAAAAAVHAHDEALACYQRALDSRGLPRGERARLVESVAYHRGQLGFADASLEAFVEAADDFAAAGDHEAEARCRVRAALTAYTLSRPDPIAPLESMLERLDARAYVARSRVHLGIAWLTATFWFPSRAAYHLAQVDARAVAAHGDIALRYHNVAAWVAMTLGDVDAFRREHARWIESARGAGIAGALASAHYNGAACFSMFGLHDDARANIDAALAVARAERSRHGEESTLTIGAFCALMRGDLAGARDALGGVSPAAENHVTIAHGAAWGTLAGLHLDDPQLIERWFDAAGAAVLQDPEGSCGAGYAEVLVRRGRRAEAEALLHRSLIACERVRGNALTLLAVARYGAPDDVPVARSQLAASADAPCELMERYALELFDAYAAHRRGRQAGAVAPARRAADGFARLGFPLLEAAAREAAGQDARALALYRGCGAAHDVRRLAGVHTPQPGAATGDASSPALSEREREIAVLVARGKSNVEIARALAISHKTVEKHLSSAYHKLGFASRAQLAAHVGR